MDDIELLISAAQEAGEIGLKHWKSDYKSWDKDDNAGPVTQADLEIDEMLRDRLLMARPNYGWLSEETEDNSDRLSKRDVFVVDPIDGTRSFIAGDATWAHSMAIVRDGRPVAGVVYLPARKKMYVATADRATLNGSPLLASDRREIDGSKILAPRNVFDAARWKGEMPTISRHFRPSLAYRLAMIGEGRFDAMVTLRDAWEWDIAAGSLIAQAAGAHLSDKYGSPLLFNSSRAKTPGVIAAGAQIGPHIVNRIKPDA